MIFAFGVGFGERFEGGFIIFCFEHMGEESIVETCFDFLFSKFCFLWFEKMKMISIYGLFLFFFKFIYQVYF